MNAELRRPAGRTAAEGAAGHAVAPRTAEPVRRRSPGVNLRSARFDELGLKQAAADRLLPLLVAAMAFLSALALAGMMGAAALAQRWQDGAAATVMVQVPQPDAAVSPANRTTRRDRVLAVLRAFPGIASARALSEDEVSELLKPWLGSDTAGFVLPLPGVIDVRVAGAGPEMTSLAERLDIAAPGTLTESQGVWVRRLSVLAGSVQACAAAALVMVTAVAAVVIAVATRAGLAASRDAIEIVHGMGATDGYIARRFARRAMLLAGFGGLIGGGIAMPVLLWLATLAAPFAGLRETATSDTGLAADWLEVLPAALWLALSGLPLAGAAIGWLTAQGTVRLWLRRLP